MNKRIPIPMASPARRIRGEAVSVAVMLIGLAMVLFGLFTTTSTIN